MSAALGLRRAEAGDRPLLERVYAGTRAADLALLPWDDTGKEAFLRMQFAAQEHAYRTTMPGARHDVVLLDGAPVGRLIVDRRPGEIAIVDIALLPEHRGAGIGTRLLERVLADADAEGLATTLHVELRNRARTLYERLGFAEVGRDGVYALLRRPPVR
jgi:ribosomal protein S18 acetylase RimI-like enzyme